MSRSTRGQNPALLSDRRGGVTADFQGTTVRDDPKPIRTSDPANSEGRGRLDT